MESSSMFKGLYTMTKWDLSQDLRAVHHRKIIVIHHIHRMKGEKKYGIISVQKAFDKIQHLFLIETPKN